MQSSDVRISQGVLALRARTSRYRGLPSSRRPSDDTLVVAQTFRLVED